MRARNITLTPEEQAELELVVRRTSSAARDVFRAGSFWFQQRVDRSGHEDAAGHGEQAAVPFFA
jgi:hypothetical protein